jgi:hypothetical protein
MYFESVLKQASVLAYLRLLRNLFEPTSYYNISFFLLMVDFKTTKLFEIKKEEYVIIIEQ